jgi:protein disulfide-isomerase
LETGGVKSLRSFVFSAALALALTVGSVSAKPGWLTDFKQAQEKAKADNKLMLVDFTGSDWCGWCIRLDREVFTKPEFQAYAEKNLVLMEVDFPRGKAQTAEQKAQNQQLAMQHGVQGFPTIIVLNAEGRKIAELGYMPGGAAAFIAALDKLRKG